jgi:hypothetical protein
MPCFGQNSSIGLILNGGHGFESFPLFVDNFGNDVDISTGGGFSIGAEYGYDFSKHFNLSISDLYQVSKLSQQGKNADGTFRRMATTITPSLVIPLGRNGYFRMLAGAGPGIYSFGTLKIDASQAGGDKMILKYKPALGLQAAILFQMKMGNDGYVGIGGKYYHVSYTFTENGSTHFSTFDKINKPNGSGIALILGFYQTF